jgi:SAM-dependent methyltransferase
MSFLVSGCGRCLDKYLSGDGTGGSDGWHVDASNDRVYDEGVAAAYAEAFFYADGTDYQAWYVEQVRAHLELASSDRLVDLGGGTGNFTAALAAAAGIDSSSSAQGGGHRPVCVDLSSSMLAQADTALVMPVCADVAAYAEEQAAALPPGTGGGRGGGGGCADKVLMKELLHHLPPAGLARLMRGTAGMLSAGGVVLAITRPQEVGYPLFEAARRVWRENQPPVARFVTAMEDAGLTDVAVHEVSRTCSLPKAQWLAMVGARFWSTFSTDHFDDAQLEAGLDELRRVHAGEETLAFPDTLLFIVARSGGGGGGGGGGNGNGGGGAHDATPPTTQAEAAATAQGAPTPETKPGPTPVAAPAAVAVPTPQAEAKPNPDPMSAPKPAPTPVSATKEPATEKDGSAAGGAADDGGGGGGGGGNRGRGRKQRKPKKGKKN